MLPCLNEADTLATCIRKAQDGVIPGGTLAVIGFQTVLASFFVSILGMRRR